MPQCLSGKPPQSTTKIDITRMYSFLLIGLMLTRESRELSGEPTCLQWLHVYGLVRSFMLEFFRVVSCIFVAPDLLAPGKMIRQANPNDGETVKAGHGRPECFFFF